MFSVAVGKLLKANFYKFKQNETGELFMRMLRTKKFKS